MEFPQKLKRLLVEKRMSQDDLARALEVSQATISNWATKKTTPDIRDAVKIGRALCVDLNYLLDDAVEEPRREETTEEDRHILRTVRALGLDIEEALRRLNRPSPPLKFPVDEAPRVRDTTPPKGSGRRENSG